MKERSAHRPHAGSNPALEVPTLRHHLSIESFGGPLSLDYRKRGTASGAKSRAIGQPVDFHLASCPSCSLSGRLCSVI